MLQVPVLEETTIIESKLQMEEHFSFPVLIKDENDQTFFSYLDLAICMPYLPSAMKLDSNLTSEKYIWTLENSTPATPSPSDGVLQWLNTSTHKTSHGMSLLVQNQMNCLRVTTPTYLLAAKLNGGEGDTPPPTHMGEEVSMCSSKYPLHVFPSVISPSNNQQKALRFSLVTSFR